MNNNIIAFCDTEQYRATESEKMRNTLKFFISVSMLRRLLADKLISSREFDIGREDLARKYGQPTQAVH